MTDPGTPKARIHDLTPVEGLPERRRDPAESLEAILSAHEANTSRKWRRRAKIWVPIITAILGSGTWAGLEFTPSPTEDIKKLEQKSEENSKKIRALGKVTVEGLDHLGKKIDAAHPEVAPIEKPPSLVKAEAEVEEQKTESAIDRALGITEGETE